MGLGLGLGQRGRATGTATRGHYGHTGRDHGPVTTNGRGRALRSQDRATWGAGLRGPVGLGRYRQRGGAGAHPPAAVRGTRRRWRGPTAGSEDPRRGPRARLPGKCQIWRRFAPFPPVHHQALCLWWSGVERFEN